MAQTSPNVKGRASVLAVAVLTAAWLIAPHEGTRTVGYRDTGGIATACVGHTGPDVVVGKHYSPAQCQAWLASDVGKAAVGVGQCITQPINANEWAAYTSLAYNIGVPRFCHSSVAREANAGHPAASCAAISLYVYAGGQKLPGLVTRRAAERALCEKAP